MHHFKKLLVWQKSVDLCIDVYELTSTFPDKEKFALQVQINRAAVSIASNIAEGSGRNSNKDFRNFLGYSNGSANELLTQLIIGSRLNYISDSQLEKMDKLISEIQKMIIALQTHLSTLAEPENEYQITQPLN
jgi:four helix bundle protein